MARRALLTRDFDLFASVDLKDVVAGGGAAAAVDDDDDGAVCWPSPSAALSGNKTFLALPRRGARKPAVCSSIVVWYLCVTG